MYHVGIDTPGAGEESASVPLRPAWTAAGAGAGQPG